MGDFVAIVPAPGMIGVAEKLFDGAVEAAKADKNGQANGTIRLGWSFAAAWPRANGSGSPIVSDPHTGTWMGVTGTCFHQSGRNEIQSLLERYLADGAERLSRELDGFFTIIIGDGRTRDVTLITDIIGSCHFYLREVGGCIAVSSSSLILAALGEVTLDPTGCQEFLGTGVIYEDRSLYHEIKKLPPASIIRLKAGKRVEQRQYWDVSAVTPESLSAAGATEALWSELLAAATKVGSQFGNVACDLTGGYDSRMMVAAFVGAGKGVTTVVSGRDDSADVIISRGLATMLGLEHLHYPPVEELTDGEIRAALGLCDGEYDVVEYSNVARIHEHLSRNYDISINGSFGEVARGYWWELLAPHIGSPRKLDTHKLATRRYAWDSAAELFQPALRINLAEHMTGVVERAIAGLHGHPNTFQMDVAYLRMRMQRWQGRIASSTDHIWPCLSPFMFRPVLEVMLRAPFAVRQRSLLVRRVLARFQPATANYPLEHGYPAVPATWRNLVRFWRVVPHYTRKVGGKLWPRSAAAGHGAAWVTSRLRLGKSAQLQATLLAPGCMRAAAILEPEALATFLKASQGTGFSREVEWQRLVSLEMALRAGNKREEALASVAR